MDDKSYQIIFETLAANQFTSRLQLKLLTLDQVDMMFSKEQTLPLGAKRLLMYQLDFLKEESPLPVQARGRMNIDETSQSRVLPVQARGRMNIDKTSQPRVLPVRARGRMNIDETSQPREKHSKSEVETRRVSLHVFLSGNLLVRC